MGQQALGAAMMLLLPADAAGSTGRARAAMLALMLLLPSPCSRIMGRRKHHVTRLGPERVLVAAGIPWCAGREWQQAYPGVREENGGVDDASMDDSDDT